MFNAIIVDDEEHVRIGLTELIDWEKLGFKIIATASSGTQAADVILKHEPHVVFIDIRMPGLTGLEVIQKVREAKKACHFVVLSGYSDFSYAKEAIGLDVDAYLLKPLDDEELMQVLSQVRLKLEEEASRALKYKEYELFEHETWLKQLLEPKGIQNWDADYSPIYQLAVFKSSDKNAEIMAHIKTEFQQTEMVEKDGLVVLLFTDRSVELLKHLLQSIARQFQVVFALSNEVETPETLPGVYRFAKTMLHHSFCFEGVDVLTLQEIQVEQSPFIETAELYVAIEVNNSEEKDELIAQLEHYYQATLYSRDRIMGELANLQISLLQQFRKNYESLTILSDQEVMHEIYEKNSLQQVLNYLLDEWHQLHLQIKELLDVNDDDIGKIKLYIDRHYADDINLKKISELFCYNSTYLGQKFRAELGVGFSKYIDEVRIEKAKILLKSDRLKIYEVAEKVGFSNTDYFYRKFKQYEGVSAKEYRKKYQKIK